MAKTPQGAAKDEGAASAAPTPAAKTETAFVEFNGEQIAVDSKFVVNYDLRLVSDDGYIVQFVSDVPRQLPPRAIAEALAKGARVAKPE